MGDGYMPSINGGQATWIVESTGHCADSGEAIRPIGVWAQQWVEVKFLVPAATSVAVHFGAGPKRLNLHYRCQEDPVAVLAALEASQRP